MATLIEEIEILGGDDEIVWFVSKSGYFSLKDTYEFLRCKNTPVWWKDVAWFS